MKTIKNIGTLAIILALTLTGLTACGEKDIDEITTAEPGEKIYSTTDFSIIYPQDWEVLERETFPTLVPHQTIVAFRNNIRDEIFTANLNVSRAQLERKISAEDFAKSTMAKIRTTLLDVREFPITYREVPNADQEKGVIIEFQGRKSPAEPILQFKSLNIVSNTYAYTITGAYLPTEDESVVIKLERMLDSFTLN